jgi:kynurenine formamidase
VVDVSSKALQDADYQITVADLKTWEERHGRIPKAAILLFHTGYSRHWPDATKYLGTAEKGVEAVAQLHFPGLHPDAARWLVTERAIKTVGLDTASIDYGQSTLFESHRILFEKNIPAFENVAALDQLPATGAYVIALPMKIKGGSGGPLRIVAWMPRNALVPAQPPAPASGAAQGKLAPRPLYRDPPFDAPTDPVLCFNAEADKWFMYYTARRATAPNTPGVSWVHGCNIGMAESTDGGATWTYRGTADINYGKDAHPNDYTYWAPEVIWHHGAYHMYLSYVPGIFTDWNHPRQIVHLTSQNGVKWDTVGPLDLKSDRVIDACVIQLPDGKWRMWYKDERARRSLCFADSADLYGWETKGAAVDEFNGEGPKVVRWQDHYWLIADCWANGMRVWSSDDCLRWKMQEEVLLGSHGDVVVSGDRAWWFYFGGPPLSGSAPPPPGEPPPSATPPPAPGRTAAIHVLELSVVDGRLIHSDPNQPTHIELKHVRETEK